MYVDSSSDDEAGTGVEEVVIRTPLQDQVGTNAGDFIGSPQVTSATRLPEADVDGPGSSVQPGVPTPQAILKATASGYAYIEEDSWSCFRVGSLSNRLHNFFNSAAYVSNS